LHLNNLNTDLDNAPEMPLSPTAKQMLDVNDAYRNGEINIEERGNLKRHIIGQALNINEHVKQGGAEHGANPMDEVMGGPDDDDDDDDDDDGSADELGGDCDQVSQSSAHHFSIMPLTDIMPSSFLTSTHASSHR
jgi:hypothetical protein